MADREALSKRLRQQCCIYFGMHDRGGSKNLQVEELLRRCLLVLVKLDEFLFILAAAVVFVGLFFHTAFAAGFGRLMFQPGINKGAHAVVHMHSGPRRKSEVNKCHYKYYKLVHG